MIPTPLQRASCWLAIGIALALLLPRLAQDGMFMDGELYAAVAHGQAHGFGTFWEPRFSAIGLAGLTTFHEHPPLTFGLQAQWFRLFGSAFWVERAYALLMAILTAWLMVLTWRFMVPLDHVIRRMAWYPILLWMIIPTVHWCFHNNMQENTMGVFTMAAVWFAVRARNGHWWVLHLTAAVCVFLASMAKGLPGLYPLVAPVLIQLALRSPGMVRAVLASALMVGTVAALYALLMLWPEANASLSTYVEQRLLHRIAEVPTVENRSATLEMLFTNMLGPLLLTGALMLWASRQKQHVIGRIVGWPLAMALIGLSGVAPLMLTMVQKSFYMAAALPMLALALALWSAPALARILVLAADHSKVIRVLRILAIITVSGSVVASVVLFGSPGRDRELLLDVHRIGAVVPPHTTVGLPSAMWNDWSLQTYLVRYHFVSLDDRTPGLHWYITGKGERPPEAFAYQRMDNGLTTLELWVRTTLDE